MPIVTDIQTISNTIGNIINFVQENEKIKEDFSEYLSTIGAKGATPKQMQGLSIPYIAERIVFDENKTVPELYIQENKNLNEIEKEVVNSLDNSISSIFEIKKRLKNGFELYNYVNEKTYTVIPLVKMTQLSEVFPGQYALIRIFKFKNDYYMLEISDLIPSYEKNYAMNIAVAKIIEKPEDLYFDNDEKYQEVKTYVEKTVSKFKDFFGTKEIITTNKKIDTLIDLFNSYLETNDIELKKQIPNLIGDVELHKYFEVREFTNSYDNFLQKSIKGFSAHNETYDIGYICDEKLGIFIIPFWATLCEIFTSKDYERIENYKECVETFIKNDKIPPYIIEILNEKSSCNFEKRLNDILGEDISFEELIKKYKGEFLKKTIFSSVNTLYCSNTFTKAVENNK